MVGYSEKIFFAAQFFTLPGHDGRIEMGVKIILALLLKFQEVLPVLDRGAKI